MTTRFLKLTILFAALFGIVGCTNPAPEETPAPRAKGEKTKAELLVGKWRLVKRTPPRHPFVEMTFEYTADGKVTLVKNNPLESGEELQIGTYRVEGNTLVLTMDCDPKERNATIESITEDKLIVSGFSGTTRMIEEYERVREK